jgi:hypothetical protein
MTTFSFWTPFNFLRVNNYVYLFLLLLTFWTFEKDQNEMDGFYLLDSGKTIASFSTK